ncbi:MULTISPECIES: cytochrome d ubiquinol oxidase subunit II [unclassified Frigoribacterium]|uniref:cytochrome d ubiquinol oxidase subunit II n=1 Tax=unclassified Frigoribacterium TaxID=2627005 RepID=UPI0006F74D29|nr:MULTISPECIES: cytochrome d ubiquinol oxidase subunit II [unclassified Frigoribacterium]KQM25295.1 cytochrome C oxidase assembly protein [Frigoribacterium sp. Leaf8]MBD8140228.1 cytochrome d ubiquinol oxidase subunit II [Frigoribacterium sp. CFBP 13605]MBD8485420.1 cytochrome d ubiquinol oxidase subunit II [Frigoribacterium sp. CFBP 8759]NQW86158.1 cytochrome d ubiquinol oxidase subunit II [Frigoribacterium sp. VKM Ac-2860]NQX07490.1 cytochrome d ubiquinol oxidase subunit II [Frigoribacteriu
MDLPTLWFVILGFFFVGYFVLDGFDFGVGMSLPFLGRDDTDRRVLINTIGPVWDLNETWVIVAGAFLFAAFPEWYATLFSGFYLLMLLILLALIARGVSFEYRHQRPESSWKRRFDLMIVVGSAVPAFVWGLVFANVVQGVPLDEGHNYTGTLVDLLNPYALLGGLTTLLLFFTHGVVFVTLKTEGAIRDRARRLATRAGLVTIVVAASFLVLTSLMHGTLASVVLSAGAAVSLIASFVANLRGREGRSFGLMALTIALAVSSLFAALFPWVMPASNDPANGLTIANASSSTYTLTIMSWVALVFVPLILGYQGFTYWIFRKRITRATIPAAH